MEPLAYLHLVQAYESSDQEFVLLQNLSGSIAPVSFIHFKRSGKAVAGLVGAVSATWMWVAPTVALAEGYASKEVISLDPVCTDPVPKDPVCVEPVPKEFVPVILGARYVKSYAGGSYYYILEDSRFNEQPAYAVVESSYHPVRPEPTPSQPLCGVFKLGDSGSGVACLQELLQKAGYFDGAITGYFGTVTCDAVIAFQHEHGLYADGVAGPQTLAVLNQIAGSV